MKTLRVSGAWTRRSIQTRVVLLVGLGMLSSLAILGATSWMLLRGLGDRLVQERQYLAQSVARHADSVLQGDLQILQGLSPTVRLENTADVEAQLQPALRDAYLRCHALEAVFLYSPDGTLLAFEPADARLDVATIRGLRDTQTALATGRPTMSNLAGADPASRRLFALVPLRDWRGEIEALAGGEIDPSSPRFASLLETIPPNPPGSVDLVDGAGVIIGGSNGDRRFTTLRDRGEVVASAALVWAPWRVLIHQPTGEAIAPTARLRGVLLWLGPGLVALAMLFAWGAARSVRRSLAVLRREAERIAAGRMTEPIQPLGDDEVGRLGRSLDEMRVALKKSLESVEQANAQLERRVEERTMELEGLYKQLREREQWRGELLRKVISAQEDERKRIARELHDETSQTLSALGIGLETALAKYPSDVSRARLVDAKALAVRTINELHRIIYDLRPSVLDDLGLLSAIRWYAERHLESRGIAVRCEFADTVTRLAPESETALFRVVQEAVTNIAKHARADAVLIQCAERDGTLTIEIEDDGQGFDPSTLPPPAARERGLGLLGMRERVELLGGTLVLDSAPGRGARIAVSVPVISEQTHA
jgi:signal transduction histidine kinase